MNGGDSVKMVVSCPCGVMRLNPLKSAQSLCGPNPDGISRRSKFGGLGPAPHWLELAAYEFEKNNVTSQRAAPPDPDQHPLQIVYCEKNLIN